MFTVGLTGGIGSGKSTVARIFRVLGVPVFVADDASKQLLNEEGAVKDAVRLQFGDAVYPGGQLDRKALASIVFNDPERLARLNAIVHPAVREHFASWSAGQRARYVLLEAALLVDTGWYQRLDATILVSAPEELRLARVMARDMVDADAVKARMRNQVGEEVRAKAATHTLVNDGQTPLIPQVVALHQRLIAQGS